MLRKCHPRSTKTFPASPVEYPGPVNYLGTQSVETRRIV
jgi:hypothetical protein